VLQWVCGSNGGGGGVGTSSSNNSSSGGSSGRALAGLPDYQGSREKMYTVLMPELGVAHAAGDELTEYCIQQVLCFCLCVCACVRACVCACVCVCVCASDYVCACFSCVASMLESN
jgi:hypothetical protein